MSEAPGDPLVVITFRERIVAVHARSGERAWEHETGFKASYQYLRVVDDRVFYVGGKQLLCLGYRSGELLWSAQLRHDTPNILVYGGAVLVTEVGETTGYAVEDGRELWHDNFKGYGIYGGAMAAPGLASPILSTKV